MTVTFDVIYLDNNDLDFERFENSLPSVRNRLQGAFCEDHSEHAHEFLQNLKIDIRNIRCRNLEEFKKRILDASEMKKRYFQSFIFGFEMESSREFGGFQGNKFESCPDGRGIIL